MGAIRINQMGYLPGSLKEFVFIGEAKEFTVYKEDNLPVFTGSLTKPRMDEASKDWVSTGNFTKVKDPGNYYIQIDNETSLTFTISDKQAEICTDALLKGFYYQRCGIELTEEYAGVWKHPVCHLQPSYLFREDAEELLMNNSEKLELIDTSGGWHDAGDYGRYTVASVKAIADLLLAYEHFPEAFDHPVHIPESRLEGPAILHEVKVGLDFLLKLQRKSDGSVYTKAATRYFPGMIMPEKDDKPIFVFDISSPATAGFAAVMAMAARIYKELDYDYAEKCLKAAKSAYEWLRSNPEPEFFKNPPHISSGEYGDDCDLDERYFAAAQMYCTTGEETYHDDFIMYYLSLKDRMSISWRTVSGYGTIAYLFTTQPVVKEIYETLRKDWLAQAGKLVSRSREDGYGITLSLKQYLWGSTMILMNQSLHLIIANKLLGLPKFDPVIQRCWDYLFGKNPNDISYVSGLGKRAIMEPHHRPSAADEVIAPVPGLLSGGPCAGLLDEEARQLCQGLPPAKCFVDLTGSYSTNEIDIYWNSVAVYVGAYLNISASRAFIMAYSVTPHQIGKHKES